MPFTILVHIPVIEDVLPLRFSLFTQFFAALILAIGLDRCYQHLRAHWGSRHLHIELAALTPWPAGLLIALVAAAALIPLVPQLPYVAAATDVPSLFDSPAIDNIPTGSVVLSYPYPGEPEDQIYLPQATSDLRFKIVGGPGHVPTPPKGTPPSPIQVIFQKAYSDTALKGSVYPQLSSANLDVLQTFLRSYDIDTIVVYPVGSDPDGIMRFVTALLGLRNGIIKCSRGSTWRRSLGRSSLEASSDAVGRTSPEGVRRFWSDRLSKISESPQQSISPSSATLSHWLVSRRSRWSSPRTAPALLCFSGISPTMRRRLRL